MYTVQVNGCLTLCVCLCFRVPVAARGKSYSETYFRDLVDTVLPAVEVGLLYVLVIHSYRCMYMHCIVGNFRHQKLLPFCAYQ